MRKILLILCLLLPALTMAKIEGEYTRQTNNCFISTVAPSGWDCEAPLEEGVAIERRKQGGYYVFLKTRGANGHFCECTGLGYMKSDVLVTTSKEHACKVFVRADGRSASFKSEGAECWTYCGARATLNADNLKKKHRVPKPRSSHSYG